MPAAVPELRPTLIGGGSVEVLPASAGYRLSLPAGGRGYADAQLDDYQGLPRDRFPWHPPLRLELEARASRPDPVGTLGFGLWNDPFAASLGLGGAARRLPAAPRAVWYFYGSPPHDLSFAPGVPGNGWKAVALDSPALPPLLLAPLAAGALAASQLPGLRSIAVAAVRGVVSAGERRLAVNLTDWHHYAIEWGQEEAIFAIDGEAVLRSSTTPPGPLGLVIWIDNQYAVLSSRRGIRFGVRRLEEAQWLEIRGLDIARTEGSDSKSTQGRRIVRSV